MKKLFAGMLALALVFGSAAVLPEGAVSFGSQIEAGAADMLTYGGYTYYVVGEDVALAKYNGTDINVTVPSEIDGKKVTFLNGTFENNTNITSVTVPNGVTDLMAAFKYCTALTSVSLPNGIDSTGSSTFVGCSNLKSITIPDSVKTISTWTFGGCTGLESVNIPNSVTEIEHHAFAGCEALTSITIPKGVTVSSDAFSGCEKLTIKCYSGSSAEKYAKDNGIKYELIDQIAPAAKASIAKAKVTGLKSQYYTGKAIKQTPTVKLGTKMLKEGTDYAVSYKNNKNIGTATVTVTGKGNYTGTVKATFKICPKKTAVKKVTSPKTKQLKVTYKKVSGVTGYQVTYSTNAKFTKKTTNSVNAAGTSKTVKKLTKGKTYYVKVRTYKTVGKTKYYSGYTAVKKIKVK